MVGIGASAGGLEALERFFKAIPADTGMAFILIQHLSPDFKSMMDELLARFTTMRICHVQDPTSIEADTIYLLPPRKDLVIEGGLLVVKDRTPEQQLHLPINTFFSSLARAKQEKAVAIVLSGTGTDGGLGIADIHDYGGVVLVQSEASAKFDGMPRNAIATGFADGIGSPEELAEVLAKRAIDPAALMSIPAVSEGSGKDAMGLILQRMLESHGVDFTLYKSPTVLRRIERRMVMSHVATVEEYLELITQNPEEKDALYHDLLINVTRFFRDPEAFEVLSSKVMPVLVQRLADPNDELRIWVPACATGEEAYSIAIVAMKELHRQGKSNSVRVFATDVHKDSLAVASAGIYSPEALENVPQDLRNEFFYQEQDGSYRITSTLRKALLFSPHNLIKDVPFNRIDLVSCRNLLIYFQPKTQTRAITAFHFSLKLNGFLFLGPSESPGELEREFEMIDRAWKFYRKTAESRVPMEIRLPPLTPRVYDSRVVGVSGYENRLKRVYDQLMDQFVPASVLVFEQREAVHIFGDARKYLSAPAGRVSNDFLTMCEGDLRVAVSSAIRNCLRRREKVAVHQVSFNGQMIDVIAQPVVMNQASDHPFVLVQFIEVDTAPHVQVQPGPSSSLVLSDEVRDRIAFLEQELQTTRESLQTLVQEMDTTNEELQASNEELQASNEELQSTNEELHSVNEELYTVNAEHEHKINELNRTWNDLRNLMSATDMGVMFLDMNLCVRMFTPPVATLYNLLPHDIGRNISHITRNFRDEELGDSIRQVMQEWKPLSSQVIGSHGERFQQSIVPYRDDSGQPLGVVLTYVDVSQLTAVQQELRDQKLALDQHSVVAMLDSQGEFTYVNDKFCTVSGWSREELIGKNHRILYLENHSLDTLESTIRSGKVWAGEIQMRNKNGVPYWVDTTMFPFLNADGKPYQFVAISTDITARKSAEHTQDRILAETNDLIQSVDSHGKFLYVNRSWCQTLGYSESEISNLNLFEIIHPENLNHCMATMSRLQNGENVGLTQVIYLTKDGHKVELEGNVNAEIENGQVVHTRGIFRDITERKRLEQELRDERDRLEQTVKERTRDLEQAKEAAEAATRAKSNFLANMSHEVRSPMSVIIGYADVLHDPEATEEDRQTAANAIRRNGEHLLQVINEVLDLSRIEADRMPLEFTDCDPWEMLSAIVEAYQVQAQEKQIELTLSADGPVPRSIQADATRFRQIVMNFLSNAVKFTETGKAVAVKLFAQRDSGTLSIQVTDQGIGMSPDQVSRLFTPFEQGDSSVTRKFGGTGLGLSISKLLAEAMGGSIEVESSPGWGSSFRLTLPVADDALFVSAPAMLSNRAMLSAELVMPDIPATRGGRILLVEDSRELQQLMTYRLRNAGYEVTTADNGRLGVELALQQAFDVVLTDIQMPEMDGQTATRELRKSGYSGPIVGLSAHAMKGEREKNLEAGMDEYLTKPVDTAELVATLQHYVAINRQGAAQTHRSPQAASESQVDEEVYHLFGEFIDGLPATLAALRAAIKAEDRESLKKLAHQLKGTAASYELTTLSQGATLLENACEEGQSADLLVELVDEMERNLQL